MRNRILALVPERKLKMEQFNPEVPKPREAHMKLSLAQLDPDSDPLYTVKLKFKSTLDDKPKISSPNLNVTDPSLSYVQETEIGPTQPMAS